MAFVHGSIAHFTLDSAAGGSPVNISAYTDTSDLAFAIDAAETTTFGKDNKTYIVGLEDATISIGGKFDAALNTVMRGGNQIVRDFIFGPAGSGSGKPRFTGDCIVTGYSVSVGVDGVVTWSADMQVTGPVTSDTFT